MRPPSPPLPSPAPDASRDNRFDLLRLLFAVSVVWSHSHILLGHGATDPRRTLMGGALYLGALCLNGFFVVSGYLVTASWVRSGRPREFLEKRARRIVPGFAVAFAVSVALAAACSTAPAGALDPTLLKKLVMLKVPEVDGAYPHNPFPGNVNGSMWTIAPEVAHYLLLLALGSAGALRRSVVLPVLAASAVLYALDVRLALPWALRDSPRLTAFFLAGVAFRLLGDRARVGRGPLLLAAAALAAGALDVRLLRLALPTAGAYLLLRWALRPRFRLDPTRRGDLSYGLYLHSFPVQQVLIHVLGDRLGPMALFPLSLALALPLALASWRFVERPFLRKKARPAVGPPAASPPAPSAPAPTAPAPTGARGGVATLRG